MTYLLAAFNKIVVRLAEKEMFLLDKVLIKTPTLQLFDYVKLN